MEKLWSFNTANFEVYLEALPEDDPDLSWADDETLEKLENGEYVNVCWHVGVIHDGEVIGNDYLGNSVYAANELDEFVITGRHRDMVLAAVAAAKANLK